ncbi:TPA: hypothetical protein N2D99_002239 [Clostridium botulinum]|nr:hypothetical protein [Clostridium botulinum]
MKKIYLSALMIPIALLAVGCSKNHNAPIVENKKEAVSTNNNPVVKDKEDTVNTNKVNEKSSSNLKDNQDVSNKPNSDSKEEKTKIVAKENLKEKDIKPNIKKLSENEVRDLSIKVDNKINDIIDVRNLDSKSITNISTNGVEGSYAMSPKYKTKQDIKDQLKDSCTPEAINNFLNAYTKEINGKLYIGYGQSGNTPSFKNDKLEVEQKDSELKAKYTMIINNKIIAKKTLKFTRMGQSYLLQEIEL